MNRESSTGELEQTIRHLYGDLLDFPFLEGGCVTPHLEKHTYSSLAEISEKIKLCTECSLYIGRKNSVFAAGNPQSSIAFVGDYPSDEDDHQGKPFTGEPGDLLQKMIIAMKIRPEEVYLTNLVKCRPPATQKWGSTEIQTCDKHLQKQFSFVNAKIIVALGERAAQAFARSDSPISILSSQEFEWQGRKVFCTHHPRDLLTAPPKKKEAWDLLQKVMRAMNRI